MSTKMIEGLATSIKAVLAETSDPAEITTRVIALAKPLAEDQSWVSEESYNTESSQGIGVKILYEEDQNKLFIETVCWMPGRGVKPHDHQTWGVVVGLDGVEKNIGWRRLDDGSKPGYAELEPAGTILAKCGDAIRLLPNDIHSVENEGAEKSLSLHIYGQSLMSVNRSEFEPENNLQRPCPQRIRAR